MDMVVLPDISAPYMAFVQGQVEIAGPKCLVMRQRFKLFIPYYQFLHGSLRCGDLNDVILTCKWAYISACESRCVFT